MKVTYKGKQTIISNNLLEPIKIIKNPPSKSYKFDVVSLYYDGKYYFLQDLKPNQSNSEVFKDKLFQIQVVYYSGKWYQDTFYITKEFKEFLEVYK